MHRLRNNQVKKATMPKNMRTCFYDKCACIIPNYLVGCSYHWQLLSPELRAEIKWPFGKKIRPFSKKEWKIKANLYIKEKKHVFT